MTAYVVIDLDVDNPEGFQEYLDGVVPLMERAGGRNVLTEPDTLVLEGDWRPSTLVDPRVPGPGRRPAFLGLAGVPAAEGHPPPALTGTGGRRRERLTGVARWCRHRTLLSSGTSETP